MVAAQYGRAAAEQFWNITSNGRDHLVQSYKSDSGDLADDNKRVYIIKWPPDYD